ncbi:Bacterial regulatory helix-turn-helix protein, lysR family [Streptomyces albus]|uniref:Bacterial regulatory helix-turn-helix protein, lysR family n=1 Tax=Streptomyces albus (strain ATCC 21838 / DSM 41398 / FERM P-419 / JCM 4703 / NBRC 107858) TaxID=1081613 RepID=A0A0B5F4W8_STRA4|nr:Bacterial regulatory helix-turn-helix protein, lysR family [Streptomyces albus]AOU80219.1 Bacterial regulatory helix-turn-helix protein, lysR family [Streptomyces albus]
MCPIRSHPRAVPTQRAPQPAATPFRVLASGLDELLRPHLPGITEEIVRAIRTEIPEYARPMNDTYMHVVHRGVETALQGFIARIVQSDTDWESVKATYQRIGKGEAEEGRSLDSFQSALRLGARVTWRRVNALVEADSVPQPVLAAFGEALLLHLDEMAAATTAGYTEARLHAAGELQLRRSRLIDLLVADPPVAAEAIGDLAHAAQWQLPREIAVVVTDHASTPESVRPIVPREFLARFDELPGRIVVPDPEGPGRARAIAAALQGMTAAVGPTVPLAEGARSLRWAVDALELARRGILPHGGLVRCTDHLATLLLFRDESLIDALSARHLTPLEQVRPPQRERLAETLLCWLQSGHNASEVAARLAVHPQTVRYRLRQLDEVFGPRLHDAQAQFEMQLALQARSLRPVGERGAPK